MALNAAIKWEVRTTGGATNGGGFKTGATGTDYSQQDAAQYALTTATTVSASATILDASAAANMVGNVLYIVSGTNFIVGFYEITSVSVGVSITVDRVCTTGNGALGVINIGGANSDFRAVVNAAVTSNTVYVKYGTYTTTGTTTLVDASVPNAVPLVVCGYKTTRGDYPKGADRPTITTTTALNPIITISGNTRLCNFIITTSGGTPATTGINGGGQFGRGGFIANVKVSGIATGMSYVGHVFFSEISLCAVGITGYPAGFAIYSHDNTSHGFSWAGQNNSGQLVNCISDTNGGDGFYIIESLGSSYLIGCVAYNNTGNGFRSNNSYDAVAIINCISASNGGTGIAMKTRNIAEPTIDFNCIYGNGTARSGYVAGANEVTGNPNFTDPSNGDFTLGSGSSCLNTGKNLGANEGVVGTY
jgi:hypothetical protein